MRLRASSTASRLSTSVEGNGANKKTGGGIKVGTNVVYKHNSCTHLSLDVVGLLRPIKGYLLEAIPPRQNAKEPGRVEGRPSTHRPGSRRL